MNTYKGVIFDFNGTLFFDNDKHVLAWSKISQEIRGKDITEQELHERCNGVPNKLVVRYFFEGKSTTEQEEYYSDLKEQYYREFCKADKPTFHLVEGVESYFNQLKENHIPFTIASASIKPNIDFFVENFHLDRWIKPENIVYDDGTYENKIEMFHKASQIIGVPLGDCRVYEDSLSGIENAYKSGCRQIVVMNSSDQKEEFEKRKGVVKIIQSFSEESVNI